MLLLVHVSTPCVDSPSQLPRASFRQKLTQALVPALVLSAVGLLVGCSDDGSTSNSSGGDAASMDETGGTFASTGGFNSANTGGSGNVGTGGTNDMNSGGNDGSTGGSGSNSSGGTTGSGGEAASTGGSGSDTGGSDMGTAGTDGSVGGDSAISDCAQDQISICTQTSPIECHFGGQPGNYAVTVDLGGNSAGHTIIEAESHRRMLAEISTQAGEMKRFSFVVNVRQPEGQPIQDVPPGISGLDLYFNGTAPSLITICEQPIEKPVTVFIAGDSTVCDQSSTDYAGWGQYLPQHFKSPVVVANYSDSGESSGSFEHSSNLWGAIKSRLRAGDWVLIQFGHNDKKATEDDFRSNMTTMVNDTKAAGAYPILFTPTSRVGYALNEEHINSLGVNLPAVIKDLGTKLNVPVIDLTTITWNWQQTINWKDYFALGTDHTHTNPKGADAISSFVADGIHDEAPDLAKHLR